MSLQPSLQEKVDPIVLLNYIDGDVLVTLSPRHHYRLHSVVLGMSSTYFRSLLEERDADESHHVELIFEPPDSEIYLMNPTSCGGFRLEIKMGNQVIYGGDVRQVRTSSLAAPTERNIYESYESIFLSFYGLPLELSEAPTYKPSIHDVEGLMGVAEGLGALATVAPVVDLNLQQHGQHFYQSIADNPASWGDFGVRIQSSAIVREAVCHLVGVWNNSDMSTAVTIFCDHRLTQLVRQKWEHLEALRINVERRILDFYPATMLQAYESGTTESKTTKGQGTASRLNDHSKNIVDWMAVNLFRQWIGHQFCSGNNRQAKDGGYSFYSIIGKAEALNIDPESYKEFLSTFALSNKATTFFDAALNRIKDEIIHYAKDLLEINCNLDVNEYPVAWLTCTTVLEEEMPWNQTTALAPPQMSPAEADFIPSSHQDMSSSFATEPTNILSAGQDEREDPPHSIDQPADSQPWITPTGNSYAPMGVSWLWLMQEASSDRTGDKGTSEAWQPPISNDPAESVEMEDSEDPMAAFLDDEFGQSLADELIDCNNNLYVECPEPCSRK